MADQQKLKRQAHRTYESYIAAINAADGNRLCGLIASGFENDLDLSAPRGACAERVANSIGFADRRGFPVWEETILSDIDSVDASIDPIRVTATIVTRFADRDEPSVESDIAYLGAPPGGGGLELLKPSGALYRAVGLPDVPPSVISPP